MQRSSVIDVDVWIVRKTEKVVFWRQAFCISSFCIFSNNLFCCVSCLCFYMDCPFIFFYLQKIRTIELDGKTIKLQIVSVSIELLDIVKACVHPFLYIRRRGPIINYEKCGVFFIKNAVFIIKIFKFIKIFRLF